MITSRFIHVAANAIISLFWLSNIPGYVCVCVYTHTATSLSTHLSMVIEVVSMSQFRKAKSKGEKERYIHLNADFQRTARRDKKAFLSDQCKEIEENNRMGKTRDLFKKITDTKGTFHAKMGQ